ncbi:PREDICTED: uncharacterized protein LOC109162247 [Ipomoea nil]|uniref:uncharacterized protein LOC109162247 n=1 Tax=Ipomoea nil TaxID=35883 RepID=UPI000900C5BA|nr:PREDICTED: uncharacterized protein LOC109162247 [Ipomoea nil]
MDQCLNVDVDEELVEGYAGITLLDEDDVLVLVTDTAATCGVGEPRSWVLVGRFLTRRMVNIEFMQQVMAEVWQPVSGVQVSELQPNLFMFVFYHQTDMQRVIDEGPWSFDNHTLVCRPVMEGVLLVDVVLDSVDMWVQVHGLPMGYTSVVIQEQVGNFLGRFVKADERFDDRPWKAFYRIRVSILVAKLLCRCMKFAKRDNTWCWVSFKYERLHTFYFFCGLLGHSYKFCLQARNSMLTVDQYPYSAEMKAGMLRGPRPVGHSWLVPVGEKREEGEASVGGRNNSGVVPVGLPVVEEGLTVRPKRRREDGRDGEGVGVSRGVDVTMSDVLKNLLLAGSGSQTRPSL